MGKFKTEKQTAGVETLYTERLILKELTLDHVTDYQSGFADYEVIRHMNDRVPWPYPANGVRAFLESEVFSNQGRTLWQWGVFLKTDPEKLIGSINLRLSDHDNRGFWLSKDYWGVGLMTEACIKVTEYAFTKLGFKVLKFTNAKGNHRSRRIQEKQGARWLKDSPMKAVDPRYTEAEHWELTKENWKKKTDHEISR